MNEPRLEFQFDHIAERLDDLADLCEHWKRNRERGRMPRAVRAALIMTCRDIAMQVDMDERTAMKKSVL